MFNTPAARIGVVAGLTCCLGLAVAAETRDAGSPARTATSVAAAEQAAASQAAAERALVEVQRQPASRASDRAPEPPKPTPTTPTATPTATTPAPAPPKKTPARKTTPRATPTTSKKTTTPTTKAAPEPTVVAAVAGLTQAQMNNAATIVKTGAGMGIPERGLIVAIATAMQESNLYNLANTGLPESENNPNEGTGYDHDSVGLFQQRTSTGWGTVEELMTPAISAQKFFTALQQVYGWETMSIAGAAQAVQVSAFPDAYAQHEQAATTVVAALT